MYTYEHIKEFLSPHILESIICVFKNGSQLFCSNCKDYDYTIITKDELSLPCFCINELNVDCFVMSVETLKQRLQDNQWRYKLSVCMAKVDKSNIIYGELPALDIDILSRDYLFKILQIEYKFGNKTYFIRKGASKTIVWGLALYYFIINKDFSLTSEQKATLQECHDNGYTAEFLADFKTMIENI